MEFILERQHTRDKTRFVVDECQTYTCGRAKENKIVCISLLVSRKHCMFFLFNNVLYVVDLKSSNGVYINGQIQNSMQAIKLSKDDIIGIGSPEFNPNNDQIYSYKVCIIKAPPIEIEEDNDITILSRIFVTKEVRKTPESCTERVLGEKCKSSSTNCNVATSCKRPKYTNDHNAAVRCSKDNVSDNDIEILYTSLVNEIKKQNDRDRDAPSTSGLNNNIKSSPNKNHTNFPNDNGGSISDDKPLANSPSNNGKLGSNDEKCKNDLKDNKQKSNFNHKEIYKMCIGDDDDMNNSNKDSNENIGEKSLNNAEPHKAHTLEKTLNNDKPNNDTVHSTKNGTNSMVWLPNNIKPGDDMVNGETNNHETTICGPSTSKVNQLKQEPRFSEVDVVELSSDEEDSIFPYSQLFDVKSNDNAECKVEIKQECTEERDEDIENGEKFDFLDIEDEVIILTDTEDEDNPWLERLSRSQLLQEENKKRDQERDHSNDSLSDLSDDNNTNAITANVNAMDIDDVSSPDEFDLAAADDTNKNEPSTNVASNKQQQIDTERDRELDEKAEQDTSTSSVPTPVNKQRIRITVTTPIKLIPIIEPIKLGPGRRQRCKYSKDRKVTSKENVITEEKVSKLKEKLKDDFDKKRQRHRHKKKRESKDRVSDHSPSEAKPGPSISKSEKRMIMEKRKMKLKELAEEKKREEAAKNKRSITRRISKPRAKLTLKNRGNFLLPEEDVEADATEPPGTTFLSDKSAELPESSNAQFEQLLETNMSKSTDQSKLLDRTDVPKGTAESKSNTDRSKKLVKKPDVPKESKSNTDRSKKLLNKTDMPKESTESKSNADPSKRLLNKTDAPKETAESKSNTDRSKKLVKKPDVPKESTESKSNTDRPKKLLNKTDVPKEFGTSSDTVAPKPSQTHAINNIATSLQKSLHLDNTGESANDNAYFRMTGGDRQRRHKSSSEESSKRSCETTSETFTNHVLEPQNGFNKYFSDPPNFPRNNASSSSRKNKVTFSDRVLIRHFEIDSNHSLKKLVGKDAPIPANKLVKKSSVTEWRPKLEEFLLRIFMWNPVWLEQQRHIKEDPPIVSPYELQSMRLHYDSYKQYYDVAMPLLLLEIWQVMTRDFEEVEKKVQRTTAVCSIVKITHTPISSTNLFLATLTIEVLVKREDFNNKTHPTFGDLVFLEYVRKINGRQIFFKVFAYVINMHQTVITDFTHFNRNLLDHVKNPFAVITYTLWTRPIEHDIPTNRVHRVRTVTYLRPSIRMIQALQYLPQSDLLKPILNPKIEDYELPLMNEPYTCSSLVTKDDLNPKQLEAVFKVTNAVLRKEAKLCFIQGPPGTGKSKVIVNLVTQILYGRQEHRHKPLRILLCAPSNAAIDELVLRLLDVRSTLKQKRFNMVRIGRPETMHPLAKTVSLTDLSRRHLTKMTQRQFSADLVSEDISIVEARLNSVYTELEYPQQMPAEKKKELKRKLLDLRTKYELLKQGRCYGDLGSKERAKFERMSENVMLGGADVIACTLSSCYTNQMESVFGNYKEKISVCIVDEATQSCEAETLIPLMLGVKTLVLVGDPNQLPATVLSQRAKKMGLDQSVFSRVQNAFSMEPNNPIIMLDTQYRMDYAISYWPNRYFYQGKLKNAAGYRAKFPFYPYRVLDHDSAQNNDKFSNTTEAEFVANIIYVMLMFPKWENVNDSISVGILTPYNNQRSLVLNKINKKISSVPEAIKKKISFEVNTVDGFQGQERDVIIMSCVRSEGIGFLSDKQRLCVALTRAKHSLILCGNFNTFMKDRMWNKLLADARSRGIICKVNANATPTNIKQFIVK